MTESAVLKIIDKVAKKHCWRKFGYMAYTDLYQHASMFCVDKIARFDFEKANPTNSGDINKALENWLSRILSNQMKNFYRDNVDKRVHREDGEKITTIIQNHQLDLVDREEPIDPYHHENMTEQKEKLFLLSCELSDELFEVFDGMLSGDHVPLQFREQVIALCQTQASGLMMF
jgi:DNA-directed RNA polymerase specialized sigma24 family protein